LSLNRTIIGYVKKTQPLGGAKFLAIGSNAGGAE
jgi:hypothetical protein